jgi:hypothetical protein
MAKKKTPAKLTKKAATKNAKAKAVPKKSPPPPKAKRVSDVFDESCCQDEACAETLFAKWYLKLTPERAAEVAQEMDWYDPSECDVKTPKGRRELLQELQLEFTEENWQEWCEHFEIG